MSADYKSDKITRILILYKRLCDGIEIDKTSFCVEHGISERSFDRDIEDIRLFLSEIYSGDDVVYDKKENVYYLKNERAVFIDRMDVAVIAKMLLSSKAFSNREMGGLLEVLLSAVNCKDRKAIQRYLRHDINDYVEESPAAILKILEDLYEVIDDGVGIVLRYIENETEEIIPVAPLEILFEGNSFYINAAEKYKLENVRRFSVSSIKSFTIIKEKDISKLRFDYFNKRREKEKWQ